MSMAETAVWNLSIEDGIAVITLDYPPVNALGYDVRKGIQDALALALGDRAVQAIVVICAGRTFFAGADITEFGKPFRSPTLNELFVQIEAADRLVVAAIHGTALGGGFELALSCHYRIAVPSARVGLPEVALGLIPGAGGTQRTPRLAGLETALDLIATGKPITAAQALDQGVVDRLAEEGELRRDAIAFARNLVAEKAPLRLTREETVDLGGSEPAEVFARFREKNPKLFKGFKAPEAAIKALEAAVTLPFDQGLARETEVFFEVHDSLESEAQRYQFFAERAAAKVPGMGKDVVPRTVASVAVIGAGTMGRGITLAFLAAGLPVCMIDHDEATLVRGEDAVRATIAASQAKGRLSEAAAASQLAALSTMPDIAAVAEADLIVEAVFEQMELKQRIFRQLDALAKPSAILASNTSFLDLDEIAAVTSRPQDVIGMHFFAPANIMRLLEIVKGRQTADDVLLTALKLGGKLRKVAVVSGVCDGFIANRLMARRSEAADRLILSGPMPWDIDRVMGEFGFPMGVFAMTDLVGLDVIGWDRENSAGRTVQERLCESGRWGQKRNGGYYDYDEARKAAPSPVTEQLIRDFIAEHGIAQATFTDAEMLQYLLDPVVNEGAKLIEEGIVLRASDIDVALVAGYGWPVFTGGPMFWGDHQGLSGIVERLRVRVSQGENITISPLLEKLAAEGGHLADR